MQNSLENITNSKYLDSFEQSMKFNDINHQRIPCNKSKNAGMAQNYNYSDNDKMNNFNIFSENKLNNSSIEPITTKNISSNIPLGVISSGPISAPFEEISLPSSGMKVFPSVSNVKNPQKRGICQRDIGNTSDSYSKATKKSLNISLKSSLLDKTNLIFENNLNTVTKDWTNSEINDKRRLVQFWKKSKGSDIVCTFKNMSVYERATNNVIVSCIYWESKNDYFITSVDCIYLLESLISVKFTVEEKNRIRRNLEGFRPLTASKNKPDSSDFYKLIMSYPNPKPRNIEKDVKVFKWEMLQNALKKIIGKYTSSHSQKYLSANKNEQIGHLKNIISPIREFNDSPIWTPDFGYNGPFLQNPLYSNQIFQMPQLNYNYQSDAEYFSSQDIRNNIKYKLVHSPGVYSNKSNKTSDFNTKNMNNQIYRNQCIENSNSDTFVNKKINYNAYNTYMPFELSETANVQALNLGKNNFSENNFYNNEMAKSIQNFTTIPADKNNFVNINVNQIKLDEMNSYLASAPNVNTCNFVNSPNNIHKNQYFSNSELETMNSIRKSESNNFGMVLLNNNQEKNCFNEIHNIKDFNNQTYSNIIDDKEKIYSSNIYLNNNSENNIKERGFFNFDDPKSNELHDNFIYNLSKTSSLISDSSKNWELTGQHSEDSVESISTKYGDMFNSQKISMNPCNIIYQQSPNDVICPQSTALCKVWFYWGKNIEECSFCRNIASETIENMLLEFIWWQALRAGILAQYINIYGVKVATKPSLLPTSISMRLVGKLLGEELKLSSTRIRKDPTVLRVESITITARFLNAIAFHAI
ncbi:hypothetical protein BB561_000431 [Smittium simulii]|uniref:DUF7082 domain-containing protein n=1 Tax=Smittium simulii TaxID=133385 RepID=A0A2T9YZ29_9FUNG|nr:hypothetical protein BB561_000431 [Smittium simulii]